MKHILQHLTTRSIVLGLFAIVLLIMGAAVHTGNGTSLARMAWNTFHTPTVALFLDADPELAFEIGEYYFNAAGSGIYDLNRAAEFYTRSILLSEDTPPQLAWYQLSRVEFVRGNFDKALKAANTHIALYENEIPNIYYVRGLIYGFDKQYEPAVADFWEYIRHDPTSPWPYNDLAWLYFAQGDYENMRDIAQKGLTYDPNHPWLLNMYGLALLESGEHEAARAQFDHALAHADTLTPADWGRSYPGNDPRTWADGLSQMRRAIESNMQLTYLRE